MVLIEALASSTPVIGLDSGAIPEVITEGKTGFVVAKTDDKTTVAALAKSLGKVGSIDRVVCRKDFENRFTLDRMCSQHLEVYKNLAKQ
jgi:glycosyltransferase involved in cell wall biosynthesis